MECLRDTYSAMVDKLVSDFYKTLLPSEPFSDGSEKIAKLFIRYEESIEPTEILLCLLEKAPTKSMLEYVLYCFLDMRESDFDVINYSIRLKRLRKVFTGVRLREENYSDEAYHTYNTISQICKLGSPDSLHIASQVASSWLNRIKSGQRLSEREYLQLSLLMKGESMALKMQSDWISTNTDAYNMRKMAKLLPLLSSTDELSQRMLETAMKISRNEPVGEPVLTFEHTMKSDQLYKWIKKLDRDNPVIASLLKMMFTQRTRMIPPTRLAAVTSIIRFLSGNKGSPFEWISNALEVSSKKGFQIQVGEKVQRLHGVLVDPGVIYHGSTICGNFNTMSINNLIGPDRLSIELDAKKDYSVQELIMMGLRNDTLMCRLLDNPKVYNIPRLVEFIAKTSRSMVVLSKIASTKELNSGFVNSGVPLALIHNPTHLPMRLLRPLINPRFISLNDMRLIIKSPYGMRHDILAEIKAFVERIK
jgi:hypothetical protein